MNEDHVIYKSSIVGLIVYVGMSVYKGAQVGGFKCSSLCCWFRKQEHVVEDKEEKKDGIDHYNDGKDGGLDDEEVLDQARLLLRILVLA